MAARCSPCDLLLPGDKKVCPVCDGDTWSVKDEWDADWKMQVARLKNRWRPGQRIPNIDQPVLLKDGYHFIDVETPKEYGYLDIEVGDVIMARERFYEVSGPVRSDGEQTGWMLSRISVKTPSSAFDFPVLTAAEYRKLDKRRGLRE